MNKETINEINNNLILLVEGFEDAERDYNYDLANEKHYVSEIIELVKKLILTDVSQQRELLKFFIETQASELFKTETGFKWREDMIEETIKNFNCS